MGAGWTHLADGRWEEAFAAFEAAVSADAAPEAFEGLSWAAWWLDRAETVFEARGQAYRRYRASGDSLAAARLALWLACDHLDFHGAVAVAQGWLARARRLLAAVEPAREHGWLAFFEGYVASALGDADAALQAGAEAAELGRRLGVPDLEMLGLALEGATLVGRSEVAPGMRRLDEATALALTDDVEVPIAAAWTCCFLVSACTAVRDWGRAAEWCDRIADFAARYGSRYMLGFCRAEYGAVQVWRGDWAAAEELLEASVDDFSRSRPAMVTGPLSGLAELRRRQGRHDEALALLDRAGPSAAGQLCRARVALGRGEALRAIELAERVLRQRKDESDVGRLPALEILVRARVARGDLEGAAVAAEGLARLAESVPTIAVRAAADVAAALLLAAGREHERARPMLEDVVDRLERSGATFEAGEARVELATTLLALGRARDAHREAGTARDRLLALGAVSDAERAERVRDAAADGGRAPRGRVTPRERDVLRLVADGLTNREIADRLVVSEHTVHRHVTNILRKLGLPSRTAAAAHAVRAGLLDDLSQ